MPAHNLNENLRAALALGCYINPTSVRYKPAAMQ